MVTPDTLVLWTLLAGPTVGSDLALTWSAPTQCPQQESVREAIDLNLGRDEFGPGLQSVVVEGAIEGEAGAWRLGVSVQLPSGSVQRQVETANCDELAMAAGLIIAVALDPLRVVQTHEAEPEVPPEPMGTGGIPTPTPMPKVEAVPPTGSETPDEGPKPLREVRDPSRPLQLDLRAGAVGEFGSLDRVRGGAAVSAGLVATRFRIDLVTQYWAPRRVNPYTPEPDAGVSVQQLGAGARACVTPSFGPVSFGTCLGFEAGASWGRGVGLDQSRLSTLPWAAAVLGQEVAWTSRRRVGVWVGADAMFHVVRPRFDVSDVGIAVETARVGARLVAGPSIRL